MSTSAKLSKLLLLDFFHLAFFMLALGLIVYALIRHSNPLIRWHEHGNVWTQPFLKIDLVVLVLIVGSHYGLIRSSVDSEKALPTLSADHIVPGILSTMIMMCMLMGAILFVILYVRQVDLNELFGLTRMKPLMILVWSVGALLIAYQVMGFALTHWISMLEHGLGKEPEGQELVTMMQESTNLPVRLLMAFSACIIAPITEEVLFRGYFYPALKRFSERYFAAVVISLLFAVIHNNTMSVVPLFILAMALTIAYELTGCLLVPILMHAIFNFSQVIKIFNV